MSREREFGQGFTLRVDIVDRWVDRQVEELIVGS